jgi:hypothetical protein
MTAVLVGTVLQEAVEGCSWCLPQQQKGTACAQPQRMLVFVFTDGVAD